MVKPSETSSTLGQLLSVRKGQAYDAKYAGDHGPFLLGMAIFSPEGGFRAHKVRRYSGQVHPDGRVTPGTVVVATTDMGAKIKILGRSASVPAWVGDYAIATGDMGIVYWHTKDEHLRSYAYWVMRTEAFRNYCLRFARGTAVRRIHPDDIGKFPISDPRASHVPGILKALEAIDQKIEVLRQMNDTLEALVRALFKNWFVDFEPVRARLDGRMLAGLDEATAGLFAESFQESELGCIPKGWTTGKLGDVATNPRRILQPNEIAPNIPYIALEHMPRRSIALSDWDDSADIASGKSAFKKGEILFGKLRPYFHKVGVAPLDGVCSTDILVLASKSPEWFGFLLGHASSDELIQFTDLASTGTKMPRTNWSDISSFKVALPPKPTAAAFTRIVQPMIDRIHANLHESHTLVALRDTLLPKLLSGAIKVAS